MAASHVLSTANNNDGSSNNAASQGTDAVTPNGNANQQQQQQQMLKHDPGITLVWSSHEQSVLEDGLSQFANESSINKYIKIAAFLPDKTVRDVAFRCRWWMLRKESNRRRKTEEQKFNKVKDKKDKSLDATVKPAVTSVTRPNVPVYPAPPLPDDNDDGISIEAIGGTTGKLLEQNSQVIQQIRANLASYKLQENTELLGILRDNIFAILNGMNDMPGISQLPSLPSINIQLADTILPKHVTQTSVPPS